MEASLTGLRNEADERCIHAPDISQRKRKIPLVRCLVLVSVRAKALSNTIETYFQIFSTKYGKFQPNIQIFEYSILCLVSHINHCLDTNKPKRDLTRANGSYSDVHDVKKIY